MKWVYVNALLAVTLLTCWASPANADARAEIQSAIQKLVSIDSYTWSYNDSNWMDNRPLALFLPMRMRPLLVNTHGEAPGIGLDIEGKVQQDGMATVSVRGEDDRNRWHAQAFVNKDKIIIDADGQWKRANEIPIPGNKYLSRKNVVPISLLMAQYFNFSAEASYLLSKTKNLAQVNKRMTGMPEVPQAPNVLEIDYEGDLESDEADRLIPPPPQANEYLAVLQPEATVKFTTNNGLLVRFDIELKGHSTEFPLFNRWIAVGISDIGYTTIVLPDAANSLLGLHQDVIYQKPGIGKAVGLDYFYNHQFRDGKQVGYTWENTGADGFSKFGQIWKQYGATLTDLVKAPTRQDLNGLSVYVIVSPSTEANAANHHPNYIEPDAIDAIVSWVQSGGVLLLFGDSQDNCEFNHLNQLALRFGITFNNDVDSTRKAGAADVKFTDGWPFTKDGFPDHTLFQDVAKIDIAALTTLSVKYPAKNLLLVQHSYMLPPSPTANDDSTARGHWKIMIHTVMAVSRLGNGTVFAVGSPWVFNANMDVTTPWQVSGNRKAGENLAHWLLTISSYGDNGH